LGVAAQARRRQADSHEEDAMTPHAIGTRDQWLTARKDLLQAEKEHLRRGDDLARRRRALPWVPVEKEYVFETDDGGKTLTELFDGREQLLVYHFMFGTGLRVKDETEGCTGCSLVADHFDGALPHLNGNGVTFVCASLAPLDRLRGYKARMGWRFPWVSSLGSDFNYDFGVAFTEEQQKHGAEYNYRHLDDPGSQREGVSAFARQDGVVHHTYSAYARGVEPLMGTYHYLDLTPEGRNEDDLPFGAAWWRRHDEYGSA
jgi:predicted dithiol-disulfide oxidoreductase (DUF899 family)